MAEAAQTKQVLRAERRQRQIIEAAGKCFVRTGFAKTTMADIALQAGLSKPILYTHFENKDAIIAALEDELVNRWLQATRLPQQVAAGGYCDAIIGSFRASFEFFFSQPVLREFFVTQANMFVVGRDSLITTAISRVRDRLAVFIAQGQAAGEIRLELDPRVTAEFLRIVHVAILDHDSVSGGLSRPIDRGLADMSLEVALRAIARR